MGALFAQHLSKLFDWCVFKYAWTESFCFVVICCLDLVRFFSIETHLWWQDAKINVTEKWKVKYVMTHNLDLQLVSFKWFLFPSLGSDECPFTYASDDSKDWSPDSPVTSHFRTRKVHSGTQTEGPQLFSAAPEASRSQPALLVPTSPALSSCPSPVPQRKVRHCVKWENRASVVQKPKEPDEESKPVYESLEVVSFFSCFLFLPKQIIFPLYFCAWMHHINLMCLSQDNQRLCKDNETLRRKLKETEREVEVLRTLLRRHALHRVEDSSSS